MTSAATIISVMSNELAGTYHRRGTFTAFVWIESMGEGGPVQRYWSGGGDSTGWLGVNAGGCGNVGQVWDGCVVVTNEKNESLAMSREDFEIEYQPSLSGIIAAISDDDWRAIVNECGACQESAQVNQDSSVHCERHDYLFAALGAFGAPDRESV